MKFFALFDSQGRLKQVLSGGAENIPGTFDPENVVELSGPIPEVPDSEGIWVFLKQDWSWVDLETPEQKTEKRWKLVRAERDRRLLASDWTQLPDVPLATKEAWATYRQALRDITEQPDPFNIVWPAAPG